MATNLDKLKAEIADMSAEELAKLICYGICDLTSASDVYCGCTERISRWLNEESEEKE